MDLLRLRLVLLQASGEKIPGGHSQYHKPVELNPGLPICRSLSCSAEVRTKVRLAKSFGSRQQPGSSCATRLGAVPWPCVRPRPMGYGASLKHKYNFDNNYLRYARDDLFLPEKVHSQVTSGSAIYAQPEKGSK